jgi:hypothetical protein
VKRDKKEGVRRKPYLFFFAEGLGYGRWMVIYFHHTGSAMRLTDRTPDAPILRSYSERMKAKRLDLSEAAKQWNCGIRVKYIRRMFGG